MYADKEAESLSRVIEIALVRYLRERGEQFKAPLGLEESAVRK